MKRGERRRKGGGVRTMSYVALVVVARKFDIKR